MELAQSFLGKQVRVIVDRPLDSLHPRHGFPYPVNYGYVPGTVSGDGMELDAYVLGIDKPLKEFEGDCIAVIHRLNDDDDKLIVVPNGMQLRSEDIERAVLFQEQYFTHELLV